MLTVKAGDEIRYGTVRLKVLWPESTASGKEVNEDAMVLEMISKDFKGLFTGDIGMVTEEKLIQNGCLEDVDFLKTAHHGSRYSTGAEFLEIVRLANWLLFPVLQQTHTGIRRRIRWNG